ncbi:MAG TPA: DUF72 domain-containing protein [Elusimicrobiota bacterium]|nr:DUF72 domain-containing protein [Elusimicrobiota bacterium]
MNFSEGNEVAVGCAAWLDRSLLKDGDFYPRKTMTSRDRLAWYARFFPFVEVNSSYYALPAPPTVSQWAEATPPGFLFGVKAWGPLTGHTVQALAVPPALRRYFLNVPRNARGEIEARHFPPSAREASFELLREAVSPLVRSGKLGYLLFQMAPWVSDTAEGRRALAALPRRFPSIPVAVEFRHPDWIPGRTEDTLKFLEDNGLSHVAVDAVWMPRVAAATGPVFVLRCHGRNEAGWRAQKEGRAPTVAEKYDYHYSDGEVDELVAAVRREAGPRRRAFLVFNNNNKDYPVRNALSARKKLGQPVPDLAAAQKAWRSDRSPRDPAAELFKW